jgi:hypothetical protein
MAHTSFDSGSDVETVWNTVPMYKYEPLSLPTAIRLLQITPGERDDPVCCKLIELDLDSNPSYEALSYVWGVDAPSQNILCDDHRHIVRQNLRDALSSLRHNDSLRMLWADAICINQEDPTERSLQVKLMGTIYSKAERTIVWLGRGHPDTVQAGFRHVCHTLRTEADLLAMIGDDLDTELVRLLSAGVVNYCWKGERTNLTSGEIVTTVASIGNDGSNSTTPNEEAVLELFRNDYFRRGWVIQEVAMSDDAVVCWGDGQLELTFLFLACTLLLGKKSIHFVTDTLAWTGLQNFFSMVNLRVMDRSYSLLERVKLARKNTSTDPLDRIYGMLAMSDPDSAPSDDVQIEPSYEMSVLQCYTQFAKRYLLKGLYFGTPTVMPLRIVLRSSQKACACFLPSFDPTAKISTYRGSVLCRLCYTHPTYLYTPFQPIFLP